MQMLGTVIVLLVLVVTVVPQERPPFGDIEPMRPPLGDRDPMRPIGNEPKRPIGGDWPIRNPQQWDNNVIINEA
jgi:hypothetical protein